MGMFDYLRVDPEVLQGYDIEPECRCNLFQTKDLNCTMASYRIAPNGKIQRLVNGDWLDYYSEGFEGTISFYTSSDGAWWSFGAEFKFGRCVNIWLSEREERRDE